MAGTNNINELLKNMKPKLNKNKFVFCIINQDININEIPKMIFREEEGTTLILKKEQADKYNLKYEGVWAMITLTIHSDLSAVGFLAKITEVLAKKEISVNAISAYYHDHLFIPSEKANETLKLLNELSNSIK